MRDLLLKVGLAALLVFVPVKANLLVVGSLVLIDLLTGVLAAYKRKEAITSGGFKRTLLKLFVYEAVVMLAYLVEQYLTGDFVPLVKLMGGLIGMTELKSVLENLEEVTGVPLLALLIQKLSRIDPQQ